MIYAAIESLLELNKELEDRRCASRSVGWQKEMLIHYLNNIDSKIKPSLIKYTAGTILISTFLAIGHFMCILYVPVSLPIVATYLIAGTGGTGAFLASATCGYGLYQHKCDKVKTAKSEGKRRWAAFQNQ